MTTKTLATLLALIVQSCAVLSVRAQIEIDGHKPFYDAEAQSWLFVANPSAMTDYSAAVTVSADSGWTDVRIDGMAVNGVFTFGDVTEDRTFVLTAVANGSEATRTVRFTGLAVIGITKADAFTNDYEPATIMIDSPDGTFANETMTCHIKHRGGSTNQPGRHKRNYKFKIVDDEGEGRDVAFFGMREDDKWLLDAGQVDMFRMRNKICHDIWLDFAVKPHYHSGEPKAVNGCRTRMTEVFVNNEYRGLYNLMEPVDRKQLKLKKYKAGDGVRGLLYKATSWDGTDFYTDLSNYDNSLATLYGWEAKYPEPGDDADTTDYNPLHAMVSFLETSTSKEFRETIADKVDIPVFIDYTLLVNLISGVDNCSKNMYWSVYNKAEENGGRLVPTPWDLDATFGQSYVNDSGSADSVWADPRRPVVDVTRIGSRLAATAGSGYTRMLESRYADLRLTWFSYDSLAERFGNAFQEIKFSGAAKRETRKWDGDSDIGGKALDFDSQCSNIKSWIASRLDFLDSVYHCSSQTGITHAPTERRSLRHGHIYNLQGQRVSESYRGVVVRNGRKYYQ